MIRRALQWFAHPSPPSTPTESHTAELDALRAELEQVRGELGAYKEALAFWSARGPASYDGDMLATWNKNLEFLSDPRFVSAYRRGMNSGHMIGRPKGSSEDIHIEWRIAMCCWAGWHARQLDGDFVECGTNTGIMSLAVCEYVDFNALDKRFFLFDTFCGLPQDQAASAEGRITQPAHRAMYEECYELARHNFAPFPRAQLVRGKVPDTLASVAIDKVAYLCIDMNIALPERAALEHFWPRMVPGGVVIFDDYGWLQCRYQKQVLDEVARGFGVEIFLLPTGQGLLIKP